MTFKKYLLLLLCLPCFVQAKNITISRLTCEMQEGLVVVESCPRLGWAMESPENGTRQTAYEIEIREAFTGRSVWNSGKVTSSQSQLVPTEGADICLNNPFNYSWRVRVWDETDTPSEWSQEAKFRLASDDLSSGKWIGAITRKDSHLPEGRKFHGGELKKPEVKAAWEAVDTLAKKSICLRRTFQTGEAKGKNANRKSGKKIVEATAYVCGLGFYEFSLNGKKIGDSEFAPLWSDYDKSVYYNTYDVTEQLQDGENVVGILLGNGFYNVQGGRYRKLQISFGPPTLLFELVINYEDGTRETIRSDHEWKYDLSPITFNCIYGGEDYDARREQKGWNQVGFNDSHWRPVVVQEAPKGVLRSQMAPPVKIMERYDIQKVTKLNSEQVMAASKSTKRTVDPSAVVLDMGQNLAGFPEITVRGKRGQKVTLIVAEALMDEGACNQRQTGRQHYYEYTLKGEGDEIWHPRFSYYGFRYIQVEGAVLMPSYMKNDDQKAIFANAKVNDVLVFNPNVAYDGHAAELGSLLKIDKEIAKDVKSDFSFQVEEITRFVPGELTQEVFDQAFGEGVVKTEEEFRAKIKEEIAARFVADSDYKFLIDIRKVMMDKVGKLEFSDALLKRIMLLNNEEKGEEYVAENYDKSIEELTWHLIKEQLVEANDIKVEQEDVLKMAKETTKAQFAQYGMLSVPEDVLDNYAQEMLKKKDTINNLVSRVVEVKLAAALKAQVTLENKNVSMEEFNKMFE